MVCETENGSSLTYAGTQNSNMSDGGAKEQQQGGFFGFCLNHSLKLSQTHSPPQTPLKPSQTHSPPQTPLKPSQTLSNPKIISHFNYYSEYFL